MQFSNLFSFFIFLFSLLVTGDIGVIASSQPHKIYSKLFVFGDSYADTGNGNKSEANSWKVPYGITFPGKPSGRFSDGHVFTDFIANHLGLKTPIAFKILKNVGRTALRYGMNFAYGGTGVFPTSVLGPNMTVQIKSFDNLLETRIFTKLDLESGLVLVTLSGNDYSYYLAKGGSFQELPKFITLVVNQLAANLKSIHGLGAKKIAVTSLEPLGCLPQATVSTSFLKCNDAQNSAVDYHNSLLKQAVAKLNDETKSSAFVIIDLHKSFTTILNRTSNQPGLKFKNPLKGCCIPMSQAYKCGSVNAKGEKMYTLCSDPSSSFFWDTVHPTQAGWNAVYVDLSLTLNNIIY